MGCVAVLAGFGTAPARAEQVAGFSAGVQAATAAADSCPDAQSALLAFNASRAWSIAGTKGGGVTIGIVGAPDRVAEAGCAIKALAPDATVAAGSASGAIVIVADTSVDPSTIGGGALVVAAAGDSGGPMTARPQGIVNVAAADDSGNPLTSSSSGPAVTLAAYGNDTSTASGYVAALAALLRASHKDWMARQVVAQMAGSINPFSGNPHSDSLGFGVIAPVQALSLSVVDPRTLPGFDAMFPANPSGNASGGKQSPPATTAPSSAPAGSSAPGGASDTPGSASATNTQWPDSSASGPNTADAWPTVPVFATGPSIGSHAAAGGGSGGFSPVLMIAFLLVLAGGGYFLWQRRRQLKPAARKPESEWEAPSGPRHSGYSPPDE